MSSQKWKTVQPNLVRNMASKTFYARAKVRQNRTTPDGQTVIAVVTLRKSLKTQNIDEARRRLRIWQFQNTGVTRLESKHTTMQELVEPYLMSVDANPKLRPRTREIKRQILGEQRLRSGKLNSGSMDRAWPGWRQAKVQKVTLSTLQAAMVACVKNYKCVQVNSWTTVVRELFALAVKLEIIMPSENPAASLNYQSVGEYRERRVNYALPSKVDFNRIRSALGGRCARFKRDGGRLFDLLSLSGVRVGSARMMKWGHVDWEHNQLRVMESKTGFYRIPLFPRLKEFLLSIKPADPVDPDMDIVKTKSIATVLRSTCRQLLVKPMTHHSLRHWFATNAVESGVDFQTLASWLGHADATMVIQVYSHLRDEHSQAEAKKLK
jgi:integrase